MFSVEEDSALQPTFKDGSGWLEFWTRSGKHVRAEWHDSE
jgi:hypothetical protein